MSTAIALQVGLLMIFLVGMLLWLDSPSGKPRDGRDCGIRGCQWHRDGGR